MNDLSTDLVRVAAAGDSALVAEFLRRIDPDISAKPEGAFTHAVIEKPLAM